jgi:DegV family protein with EDD domain
MTVKIITESVCDLPAQIVKELGITVIPLPVHFGTEVYRDGVDISTEEFYQKLETSKVFPTTAIPPPGDFVNAYDKAAEEADEILHIALSSKLSGLYNAAKLAVELMTKKCRVEVLDSQWVIMAQGFLVMKAAKAAREGANLDDILNLVRRDMKRLATRSIFDTLEYLKRGGRISKVQAALGGMMHIHPILGVKDGEVASFGRARSRDEALEYLYDFVMGYKNIEELSVAYYKAVDDAEKLIERLDAKFPKERIIRSRTSPVIGAHTGPNLLVVVVLGDQ